jgi:radical SAM protein with 4Fe4S-binding SPASM domain
MGNVLVRNETFGPLVFSQALKGYFLPRNQEVSGQISNVLTEKNAGSCWKANRNPVLVEDLIKLGFEGSVRELTSDMKERLMAPLEVYFDFTYRCNLACPNCYNRKRLTNMTMPEEKVSSIMAELYEMGVMRVHLAGGEPTLERAGLINYLGSAREHGLVTSLSTNGVRSNPGIYTAILEQKPISFTFSIDGPEEEYNRNFRGEGVFEKTIASVRLALGIRDRMGADTKICMKSVCSRTTPHIIIQKLVDLAVSLGIDEIKFYSPERSLNSEPGHYGKSVEKYYELVRCMVALREAYSGKVKVSPVINPVLGGLLIGIPGSEGCIGANELLTINPDGTITPCLMMHEVLGNVHETSLRAFWSDSEKLRQYRKKISNSSCTSCGSHSSCRGGCQVRKKVEHGQITGVDPLCPVKYHGDASFSPILLEPHNPLKLFRPVCNAHSL